MRKSAIDSLEDLQSAIEEVDLDDIISEFEELEQANDELQDKCNELEAENDELRDVNLETPENAATQLLERYTGENPSAGEVLRLKERISEILVSEFGISAGKI